MRTTILAACLLLPLTGCALLPEDPDVAESNPFFQASELAYELPPFDRIRDEHYAPALTAGMREQIAEVEAIAANPEPASFDNTLLALEQSGRLLDRVSRVFFNLASAHRNDTIDAVRAEMAPKLAAHEDAIFLNRELFARVDALYRRRDELDLDRTSARLLERYHTQFVRAGARLGEAEQTRLKELNAELASLTTRFQKNLQDDTNAAAVVVEDRARLAGLSDNDIAAAAEAARERDLEDRYVIALRLPTSQPPLESLHDRDLRERIHRASILRGNNGNDYDNKAVVRQIVSLRAERARLLGYDSHADYVLEDQTAETKAAVNQRLARLTPPAVANARAEAADLQALIDEEGGDFALQAWDWPYYAEKLRQQRYDFDASAMRPYLELNRVLEDGVFYMAQRLYGLSFQRRDDLPVYHPDVSTWEVFEEDGQPLGLFVFDPYARPSKRGGAWMNSYVGQSKLLGQRPVVANHLNISKPPAGEPVLLSFDEVNTLFHEFGHALHGLFSDVHYPLFSGTSVPRDFVEYPSQVHEMWATWPEVLRNYARHHETGERMPQALVDKFLAARKFNQGYATTEYLAASLLDQAWHQLASDAAGIEDVIAFEQAALTRAGVDFAPVPPRYRSTYFSHVFAGGYSAGYYSYIWSEVLDADTVQWFEEQGGLERINGDWFRAKLLSRGGAEPALDLFVKFRGRPPRIEPLLERRGLN